jgi:capsular exopolysaccharide synthesis family protein
MSTFFRALERAEQERALRRPTTPSEPTSAPSPTAPALDTVPAQVPQSVFGPPRPAAIEPEHTAGLEERAAGLEERASELDEHLVSLLAPTSFEAEQYRELRHAIEQLRKSVELSVIAVSSPVAADGKTTTAINLAGALAQAPDARVLLVDADLREPSLAAFLGIRDHAVPGLVDAILNTNLPLEAVTQAQPYLNLSVITAGRRPSAPYEILKSPRVRELFAETRQKYDYVIVDTPPLVSVPDGRVFGEWLDGFLIVVAAHRTPRKLLEEAFNLMEPSKILGLVFNGDDHHVSRDSYGRYGSSRSRISRNGMHRRRTASDE